MSKLYACDPRLHPTCDKEVCYLYGGPCHFTLYEEYAIKAERNTTMENEIRYYLAQILACMEPEEGCDEVFEPQYIITAVKLPTGAIEVAVNNQCIKEKIEYILEAYDSDMRLKSNPAIVMQNIMVV